VTGAEPVFRNGGGACLPLRERSLFFVTGAEPVFREEAAIFLYLNGLNS